MGVVGLSNGLLPFPGEALAERFNTILFPTTPALFKSFSPAEWRTHRHKGGVFYRVAPLD